MGAPLIAVTRHSDANELTTDMELSRAVPVYFPAFALLLPLFLFFCFLFHRRTREVADDYVSTAYVYGCLTWHNVVLTPRVRSTVKFSSLNLRQIQHTTVDVCDGAISVLNHCLSWSKFVVRYTTVDSGLTYTNFAHLAETALMT